MRKIIGVPKKRAKFKNQKLRKKTLLKNEEHSLTLQQVRYIIYKKSLEVYFDDLLSRCVENHAINQVCFSMNLAYNSSKPFPVEFQDTFDPIT